MMLKDVDQRTGEAIGVGHVDHLSERQDDGEVLLEKQLLERSTRFEMLETLILEVSVVVVLLLELVRVEVDVHVVVGVVLGLVVAPHDEGGGQQRDDHATEADGHRCALVPRLIELFRIAALEAVDGDRDVGVGAGVQAVGEAHPEQCIARVLAVLQRSGHDHTAQHVGHHGGHLVDERTAPLLQCHVPKVMASAQSAAAAAAAVRVLVVQHARLLGVAGLRAGRHLEERHGSGGQCRDDGHRDVLVNVLHKVEQVDHKVGVALHADALTALHHAGRVVHRGHVHRHGGRQRAQLAVVHLVGEAGVRRAETVLRRHEHHTELHLLRRLVEHTRVTERSETGRDLFVALTVLIELVESTLLRNVDDLGCEHTSIRQILVRAQQCDH
mmetsp:Transcript_15902/g.40699  ORF Transcript_15902/g.40699 Transcript_15902/m.40699 type:complete len:385 (-) Transcript_15902:9147-10301(-)